MKRRWHFWTGALWVLLPVALLTACGGGNAGTQAAWASQAAQLATQRQITVAPGRTMFLRCRGHGQPTVLLVAGYRASADDWGLPESTPRSLFDSLAALSRTCAYDRPGTPVGEAPSRSDPIAQPTTVRDALQDLRALMQAAGETGPYVLVGHSYGGLLAKLYARQHPEQVRGLVLLDALSEGLQEAQSPEQWEIQRLLAMSDISSAPPEYPALERVDIDASFDQVRAAPALGPLPLAVLSADVLWGPQFPALIAAGRLPPGTPPNFGDITDAAQRQSQAALAALVPGALHVTRTDSGHDIHKEQPQRVIDATRAVLNAVRAGQSRTLP